MERATVNVATGALGPLLQKLTALLVREQYRSRLGGTLSDIEFIKSELASLHSLLLRIWEREDLGAECIKWMIDARELSYDMEDDIEDFMLGLNPSDADYHGGGTSLESLIRRFMTRVVVVSRRCHKEWKTAAAQPSTSNRIRRRSLDPRAGFRHRDASELVGMDEPKRQLLKLLKDQEMVCIHGFAGMGKTTLVDLVYHEIGHEFECRAFVSLSISPDLPEVLRAVLSQVTDCVQSSGSRNPEAVAEENLCNEISNFLSNKRYLVIVDDIWHWEDLEIIRRALPEGVPRCRILATTRANVIAEKCRLTKFYNGDAFIYHYGGINDQDAATLSRRVLTKQLQDKKKALIRLPAQLIVLVKEILPKKIAEMCCGMPLAVECLSSAVASIINMDDIFQTVSIFFTMVPYSREKAVRLERLLWHVLLDGLLSSGNNRYLSLKPLAESLCLGYDDLPLHTKTCLLHCSMYPTGYLKIERHGLVRKWMAEGFVYHEEGKEAAAAAEGCLDELVSRGLLQPAELSEEYKQYYSVHPMMRAFLVCKSKQAAFAAYHEDSRPSILDAGRICRLSVGFVGRPDDIVSVMDGASRTRSLVVFSNPWPKHTVGYLVHWGHLVNLRVLSIESTGVPLSDIDLDDICSRLLRLRYLALKGTPINVLPPQIWRLRSLETLDVSNTHVGEVPNEIQELCDLETLDLSNTIVKELPGEIGKLQRLQTLDASNTSVTELPKEIGKLQELKTLNVSHTSIMELPREIGELYHLKTLIVSHTEVRELLREIEKLQRLETLDASNTSLRELPREIGELHHLKTLNVSHTRVSKLPSEVGKLQRLETLDVSYSGVRELPREIGNLQHMKTLNVSHTSVRELPWLLANSFSVLAGNKYPAKAWKLSNNDMAAMRHLDEDTILSSLVKPREDLTIMLYDHPYQLLPVAGLKIVGRHIRVPDWVKQHMASVSTLDIRLCKLDDEDLEFLCKKMPNLQHLTLRLEVLPRKAIVITGTGFSRLMSFYLDCRLPMVTFQHGAMPKLEHLEFKFYTSRAITTEDVGIRHLLSLKRVVFQSSPRYKSNAPGISMVINKVREEAKVINKVREAKVHQITISINGKDEEVIQENNSTMTTSASDMISEIKIVTSGGTGGSSGASMGLHVPYNNGSDDENGSIIPVESYYTFSVNE